MFEFKLSRNVSCDPFNFIVCYTCGIVDIYASPHLFLLEMLITAREGTEKKKNSRADMTDRKKHDSVREKQSSVLDVYMKMAMAKHAIQRDIGTNRGYSVFIMVFLQKMAYLVGVCIVTFSLYRENHCEQNVFNHFT